MKRAWESFSIHMTYMSMVLNKYQKENPSNKYAQNAICETILVFIFCLQKFYGIKAHFLMYIFIGTVSIEKLN